MLSRAEGRRKSRAATRFEGRGVMGQLFTAQLRIRAAVWIGVPETKKLPHH